MLALEPREYSNRVQHVQKPLHANFELRRCQECRVMSILMFCLWFLVVFKRGEARRGGAGQGGGGGGGEARRRQRRGGS